MVPAAPASGQSNGADWPEAKQQPFLAACSGRFSPAPLTPHIYMERHRLHTPTLDQELTLAPHSIVALGGQLSWLPAPPADSFAATCPSTHGLLQQPARKLE